MVAVRPLVAGSFTPATATAGVGSAGRPWRERPTPQKVARETWPSGAFQGNRYTVSASALVSSGRARRSNKTLWVTLKAPARAWSSATSSLLGSSTTWAL
eukprot:8143998-Alexandrium_andersonii.AAC.1